MMGRWFLLLLLAICVDAGIRDFMRPKTIRIVKFEGTCEEYKDASSFLEDIHILLVNRKHVLNFKWVFLEDLNTDYKIQFKLKRCPSREALDACENYKTITLNHMCDLLNAKNTPWTPLLNQVAPPVNCPLKKGVYAIRNGTFDGSALSHLPVTGWYWIIKALGIRADTGQVFLCITVQGQILPI